MAELLDLLGILDADRIVAIYYALPEERREIVTHDPVPAYYIHRAPLEEIAAALVDFDWLDPGPIAEPSRALLAAAAGMGEAPAGT